MEKFRLEKRIPNQNVSFNPNELFTQPFVIREFDANPKDTLEKPSKEKAAQELLLYIYGNRYILYML
jgi:hypothetical protein